MAESAKGDQDNWGFGKDDLESSLAGAMYGAAVENVREQVSTYDIGADRLRSTFRAARTEADRSAAILMFALAEDLMLSGLRQHLRGEVSGGWAAVSSGNGLLATANDRITLLALLGWIRRGVYADLRALKSIRNLFAHHPDTIGFDDGKATGYISTLTPVENSVLPHLGVAEDAPISARQRYLIRAGNTLTHLLHDLAIRPIARQSSVAPEHVERRDWDGQPSNFQELYRILSEHALAVVKPASS